MHPKFPSNYDPLVEKNRYNVNTEILFMPLNDMKKEQEMMQKIYDFYEKNPQMAANYVRIDSDLYLCKENISYIEKLIKKMKEAVTSEIEIINEQIQELYEYYHITLGEITMGDILMNQN